MMLNKIKSWFMKQIGVNSLSEMFRSQSYQTDFYNILTSRELCVLASAMAQSIDKYKDLYNNSKSDHYMNQRTLQNIQDMQYIHDMAVSTLKRIGVKPEEVE